MISYQRKVKNAIFKIVAFCAALFAIIITFLIFGFVITRGIQPFLLENRFGTINIFSFLTGATWRPKFNVYGIGYMILATVLATFWAVALAIPVALSTSIFTVFYLPRPLAKTVEFLVECLSGIPSIFFGIFGFIYILPFVKRFSTYPQGESLVAVIIVLGIMTLPSMVLIMINSLQNVPISQKEGSFALGASKRQAILTVFLPSAKRGIITGIIIGITRAIGETMAVAIVAGNRESGFITSPFQTVRLLTTNIILEQSYATDLHAQLLWSTAIVLLIFVFIINLILFKLNGGNNNA